MLKTTNQFSGDLKAFRSRVLFKSMSNVVIPISYQHNIEYTSESTTQKSVSY